ncbi:MAG: hypothetical protein Tsb0019_16810 [Roseibium sp.]
MYVVPDPDWILIGLPLRWVGDYVFNGLLAKRFDFFLSAHFDGYVTTGEQRDNLGIGVRKARLAAAWHALSGGVRAPFEPRDLHLELGEATGRWLQRRLLQTLQASMSLPLGSGRFVLEQSVEDDLICLIARLLLDRLGERKDYDPGRTNALKIVRNAETAVETAICTKPSLADLCSASGVSRTWLNKCFAEVYGTSPVNYLNAKRLTAARDQLLDPVMPPPSVKDVALSLGFINSGRFASDYHARFGEFPSETLERTRKVAGLVPLES